MEAVGASRKVFEYMKREPKIKNEGRYIPPGSAIFSKLLKPPFFKEFMEKLNLTMLYSVIQLDQQQQFLMQVFIIF